MAHSELLRYIQDQLRVGVGKDAIKKTLSDVGWSQVDIDDAFKAAEPSGPSVAMSPVSISKDVSTMGPLAGSASSPQASSAIREASGQAGSFNSTQAFDSGAQTRGD